MPGVISNVLRRSARFLHKREVELLVPIDQEAPTLPQVLHVPTDDPHGHPHTSLRALLRSWGIKDEHRRGPAGGSDLLIFTEISRDTAVERNPSFCALLGEDICREQHRIMTDDQARIVNAEQVPDPLFTADDLQ